MNTEEKRGMGGAKAFFIWALEHRLWAEFKRHGIPAERQELVTDKGNN